MKQEVKAGINALDGLSSLLAKYNAHKVFIVCDTYIHQAPYFQIFLDLSLPIVIFSEFSSNPLYEDVIRAVKLFQETKCDTILAVGGGSAIDVAKCVKLYSAMNLMQLCFEQLYQDNSINLVAVPTTAGTGSESTRFAVIYYQGRKMSIFHDSILPKCAFLDPVVLSTLPLYQKKCTLLDALCQAIESWWSINATEESIKHSQWAIRTLLSHLFDYLEHPDLDVCLRILQAANEAGQAINLTQTTAPHAMSYKLTSIYHIPHGHSVAICLPFVWEYMLDAIEEGEEPRLQELGKTFEEIAEWMNCKSPREAISFFWDLLAKLKIFIPDMSDTNLLLLADSVNPERLRNNPLELSREEIYTIYSRMNLFGMKYRDRLKRGDKR